MEVRQIIRQYNERIILIEKNRCNIAQGFNVGVKASGSEWIGIVATGNNYEKTFFEELSNALQQNGKKLDGAYAARKGCAITNFGKLYCKELLFMDNGMPTNQGSLIHKSVFEDIGYFYEKLYYAGEDTEYYRRAVKSGKQFLYVDRAILYREVPENYRDYFKQTWVYTIGNMQVFSNAYILLLYKKHFAYLIWSLSMIFLLFMHKTMYMGLAMCVIYLLYNIKLLIKKGWIHCKASNIRIYTQVSCLIMNIKYLSPKNKIDRKHIITYDLK